MGVNSNKKLVDVTIKNYLKKKVQEKFPEDYHLIESKLDDFTDKYNLKELLIIVFVEIEKVKNRKNLH